MRNIHVIKRICEEKRNPLRSPKVKCLISTLEGANTGIDYYCKQHNNTVLGLSALFRPYLYYEVSAVGTTQKYVKFQV